MSLSGCSQLWKVRIGRNIGLQEWVSLCQGILTAVLVFVGLNQAKHMQIKKGRGMKVIILSNTDWFIHTTPTQVCSPEDMVGFTESAKCAMIRKIFDDAYRFKTTSGLCLSENILA